MNKHTTLVIEHLEPALSDWLMLEYRHSVKIWKDETVFTNVLDKKTADGLKPLGKVKKQKANTAFSEKNCIILDPQAKKPLKPADFTNLDAIIVGGILGYEKPQGRTKELLSEKSQFELRHLGDIQLTIDSAVFVTKAVYLGLDLSDIEITKEIEIIHDSVHSTILPFGYPIIDDKPVITPGLVDYLSRK